MVNHRHKAEQKKQCKGMPIMHTYINKLECFVGIDTGADHSLISSKLMSRIQNDWRSRIKKIPLTMSGVTGHRLKLHGQITLPVTVTMSNNSTKVIDTPFIVWENIKAPILLGNHWLRENEFLIDPTVGLIHKGSNKVIPTYCRAQCTNCTKKWRHDQKNKRGSLLFNATNAREAFLAQGRHSELNTGLDNANGDSRRRRRAEKN